MYFTSSSVVTVTRSNCNLSITKECDRLNDFLIFHSWQTHQNLKDMSMYWRHWMITRPCKLLVLFLVPCGLAVLADVNYSAQSIWWSVWLEITCKTLNTVSISNCNVTIWVEPRSWENCFNFHSFQFTYCMSKWGLC